MSRGSYNTTGSTHVPDRYIQGKRKPETQDPVLSWGQSLLLLRVRTANQSE